MPARFCSRLACNTQLYTWDYGSTAFDSVLSIILICGAPKDAPITFYKGQARRPLQRRLSLALPAAA